MLANLQIDFIFDWTLEINVTVIQVFVFLNCSKVPVYVQRYVSYIPLLCFLNLWNVGI